MKRLVVFALLLCIMNVSVVFAINDCNNLKLPGGLAPNCLPAGQTSWITCDRASPCTANGIYPQRVHKQCVGGGTAWCGIVGTTTCYEEWDCDVMFFFSWCYKKTLAATALTDYVNVEDPCRLPPE